MRIWFLSALLLMIAPIISAQDAIEIAPGEPVTVQVNAEAPALLTFVGAANERFTLTTEALGDEPIDTVLEVLTPQMQQLAYSDDRLLADGQIDRNAHLTDLFLPEVGLYTIRVDSFNGVSEGEVVISLEALPRSEAEIEDLDSATRIQTKLRQGEVFSYSITLEAEAQLTITARDLSGTLDPIIHLRDEAGAILASNDDHTSDDLTLNLFDAQIVDFGIGDSSIVQLEVLDFLGRAGDIEIRIE